ncbi:MAG: MotA/TolQ/ExbB proton channel family protein [Fibrobacterota bacterium]
MKKNLLIISLLLCVSSSFGISKKQYEAKLKEVDQLNTYLQSARDSLQEEISERWSKKQDYIKQRERDKEDLDRQREKQERAYSELARIKEEFLAKEKKLAEEKKALEEKEGSWKMVKSSLEDAFSKESENFKSVFPLELEKRKQDLEKIRREYRKNYYVADAWGLFADYKVKYYEKGSAIDIGKHTVLPSGYDEAQFITAARFGDVFAYGINSESEIFYIRQTGRLGAERYSIEKVVTPEIKEPLQASFPKWVEKQKVTGTVITDVLQNDQTKILLSGKKIGIFSKFKGFVKSGGPVMVPLLFLPLWALVLIIMKFLQFRKKHKSNVNIYNEVEKDLGEGNLGAAEQKVSKIDSVVARIVETCLKHSKWKREKAEEAVNEILVDELPLLNKYLSTLAVIAGAAPLLGLLGTVTGMINLFEVITHYGTGDPKIMAGGISEALITTQTGLAVAIPILLIHNYLKNKRDNILAEMEKHAVKVLNRLWPEE